MAKKFIDIMDTTFRDGFQSVFGGRVLAKDFFPAVEAAKDAGIRHFEFGGGARFQSLYFYLNEDAFEMMDKFRSIVGKDIDLQTLARGVNTVTLDTGSREIVDLHAKLFKKHGTTTIRNFDALNDVENLKYSGERIKHYGLKHEVVVTMMDLPPGCVGAHDVSFYEKTLRNILASEIEFDSICFKDASGTSNPQKVYETIQMARKILPSSMHIRLHTHETAGVSVSCYLAALEAGVDGIDLAASPVSGGTSQPDILTMLHAIKGKNYDLGGLDTERILQYEEVLNDCLKDYFMPPEATQVSPLIPFSPMPGGALTSNTQMMRDNNLLHKYPEVIKAMREVVEKGGYGTSVTPVSQFYFQQAFNNVMFGPWKKIAEGYGKMVLGYFGKTPVEPDSEIVSLSASQLNLEPTLRSAIDIADEDETKSLSFVRKQLEVENIPCTEENVFIVAACKEKGLAFLKGEASVNVRKKDQNTKEEICNMSHKSNFTGDYTIVVNGTKYSVQISEGSCGNVEVKNINTVNNNESAQESSCTNSSAFSQTDVLAGLPGLVLRMIATEGSVLKEGDPILVLEAMKMEIEVVAPCSGVLKQICVSQGASVEDGQVLAILA